MEKLRLQAGVAVVLAAMVMIVATPTTVAQVAAATVTIHRISGPSPLAPCNPVNDATGTRGFEQATSLVADPRDSNHLAAVWTQDFEDGSVLSVSRDAGTTWHAVGVSGQMPACEGDTEYDTAQNPHAAVGPDGTVYVVSNISNSNTWQTGHGQQAVRVNATRDDGATWVGSTTLETAVSLDWVWMAADPQKAGTAYVLWGHREVGPAPTDPVNGVISAAWEYVARTTDFGKTWTRRDATTYPHPPTGSTYQFGRLAVIPDGSLVDVFTQCDPTTQCVSGGGVLHASRSTDGGAHWSAVGQPIVLPSGWFASTVTRDGEVLVSTATRAADGTWQMLLYRSTDAGTTWGTPVTILAGDPVQPVWSTMAVAGDGSIGVLYYDKRNAPPASVTMDPSACQQVDDRTCATDAWLTNSRGSSWIETHLAGPFEVTKQNGADCCHGVGEWQGLIGRSRGFFATLAWGPSDTADPNQQVVDGPTDVFFATVR
ncbi:MAG: hypothetical protein QOC92_807 [Acidimicrobiaceae bacterium]|jgi:hypothetical protein